jgi:hypothetical protein
MTTRPKMGSLDKVRATGLFGTQLNPLMDEHAPEIYPEAPQRFVKTVSGI